MDIEPQKIIASPFVAGFVGAIVGLRFAPGIGWFERIANVTTGALTAQRNLVVPLVKRSWKVRNNCTGFGVQVIGSSGTGIVVGVGKTAIVECDATNVLRVTADV